MASAGPPCFGQVVNKIMEDFEAAAGSSWRGVTADTHDALPVLEPALEKYQVGVAGAARPWGCCCFWAGCCCCYAGGCSRA